ncbi:MAG: 16S rRNA (guanine(527)-N(7))-methyltransferase RsmG, partial [Prevotella sp.]|nr:16S rRNA (guanine(527)-N(7))-methyltransferase RsmG [Prevotella sp.]
RMIRKNISDEQHNALPNGVIVLKGGDLTEELKPFGRTTTVAPISDYFHDAWFEDKKMIYLPI